MVDFRPEQIANLIQRSPEFASEMKIKYPDLTADIVSFTLNPDCSCKKKIIKFARRNNEELNEFANTFIEERTDLNINMEAVFKNQPIQESRTRKEMDLTPEQVAFLNKRKGIVEQKRAEKKALEQMATKPPPAPPANVEVSEDTKPPTQEEINKDVEAIKQNMVNTKAVPVLSSTRDIAGEVMEIEPQPAAYKKMLKYINDSKWSFKGLSVLETEKLEEGSDEPKVVWLVFFY